MRHLVLLLSVMLFLSCKKNRGANTPIADIKLPYSTEAFNDYWYTGKAEVASYRLEQVRYGEIHNGHAVLIFVTEPFSRSKHVKLDDPENAKKDKVTVMKMNFIKKFNTGIYPYSMMLSSFTPVEADRYPQTLKVTMSAQEWCGHVFSQINLKSTSYTVRSFSYFEQDGDQDTSIEGALLEDDLLNRIRLNYLSLPTGDIRIIPGLFYSRLHHKGIHAVDATAELTKNDSTAAYKISYPARTLTIYFNRQFPYTITSWREVYEDSGLMTTATLKKKLHIDYWNKNKKVDLHWRDSLDLPSGPR